MKDTLLKTVKDFLTGRLERDLPVLVGLSGGVDSSALLSLLLECRNFIPMNIHVAHFDHAWRSESLKESYLLRDFVENNSIPFHLERSQGTDNQGNLEEKARNERFEFFQRVYLEIGAQALVLAHQKEDQAETVLKRIFEGAGILSLGGMESTSLYESMRVWRPLLGVSREELQKRNEQGNWVPFEDRTNYDLKFLRPRMREELFPLLEECFGKKVRSSLFRVGEELSLLKSSLQKRLLPYLDQCEVNSLGSYLPLETLKIKDIFEVQEVVRLFCRRNRCMLSSDSLKKAVELLEAGLSNKQLDISNGYLLIERGALIWLKAMPSSFQGRVSLEKALCIDEGKSSWKIEVSPFTLGKRDDSLLTRYLKGELSYRIDGLSAPILSSYDCLTQKDQKKISTFLSKNKIPAKMKGMFPFVINNDRLVECDFCFNLDLNQNNSSLFSNIILKM